MKRENNINDSAGLYSEVRVDFYQEMKTIQKLFIVITFSFNIKPSY